ncbi:MAG TPA: serine/threonine-protein kinase [Gemmatimonadales bacterium]|nr:serine/threonine-protein kinase [Gemmatimonadales bacterium]
MLATFRRKSRWLGISGPLTLVMAGPHVLPPMAEVPEHLRTALHGRYDLQRELGRGGMAAVFAARDLRYDRLVAIKVLNPDLAAAVGRARFLREIQIAAQLNHPHILPLLDSGEAGDLLYYVMPCVEGESLKERIEREKQLPVRDAIAIARDVAAALSQAHSQGIVHRDVKPGNIMLSSGAAVMTDFGIARAVRRSATDDTLTDVNLAIGTPTYMSPEQWSGTRELDARSDIYSLGCVVYEMLAGQPPFTGSTTEAIAARVVFDPVPPIRTVRPKVSVALERVILRALEKVPADRYATVAEFADELAAAPQDDTGPVPVHPPVAARRWAVAAAGGVAVAAAGWFFVRQVIGSVLGVPVDTTRYAILPFEHPSGVAVLDEESHLSDALSEWTGITVVPPLQVREAARRYRGDSTSASTARRAARRLGAGRFVRGQVSRVGDSLRVWAGLYALERDGSLLRQSTVRLDRRTADQRSAFALLANSLLFGGETGAPWGTDGSGTTSAPALWAFARGRRLIGEWELAAADSALAAAVRHDPAFARALLWLALARAWSDAPKAAWRSEIERATPRRATLSEREGLMLEAVRASARDETQRACSVWTRLAAQDSTDFASWYEKARCLRSDAVVVRDRASPSGWRFRSSTHEAVVAYQRAFQLLPPIHKGLRANSYEVVRRVLYTTANQVRFGRAAPPDTTRFFAYLSLAGDTIASIPFPAIEFQQLSSRVVPATRPAAIRRVRVLFRDVATSWATAFPQSVDALLALGVSLDLLADPAAIDTVRRARSLAHSAEELTRSAGAEFWLRLKYSLPDDLPGLREACALADSLIRGSVPSGPHPMLLASIATVTGRGIAAAMFARQAAIRGEWTVPPALARSAPALMVFASLGGPLDSLRALEQQVAAAIPVAVESAEQESAREEWLARAGALAFPVFRFPSLLRDPPRYYLFGAQVAAARGDTQAVRRVLATLRQARRLMDPADVALDAVYPEAWVLAAIGDTSAAMTRLDPVLESLRAKPPEIFVDIAAPGALTRAMNMRAELAAAGGDPAAAARWARAITVLWADADGFLQPIVRRMQQLVR